ncbi:3-oxoacyl-[acyl-carrier-protein] reductase [Lentzea sp. NBRC 105346]|uniref:3-oxoacyl-ACP reductase family protein n=1 Tax=Lentzea sp. NBRC 105346 TaxID=3032205 RepID=UPI0024A5162F|nr:3-oxoacyl-ACP reductase family protein [Lentzea sp. NBRC 105346]GLZ29237.1 3-oxoacyl-[acyl-carrier-protein] reductase [Lentzea sp. NBRC 105346]
MSNAIAPDARLTGDLPLAGKRLVVTGGSRGIGAAVVRLALAQGAEVVFGYHSNAGAARALCAEMNEAHPDRQCLALPAEVSDAAAVDGFATAALECLGTLDVLVNNAGIVRDSSFARMARDDWDDVIETNLGGVFNVTQQLVLPMVKQRRGAVINVSSVVGVHGAAGQTGYAASKAGVIGFTKALSKEVGRYGVTVNAVAPGLIETDMTAGLPQERVELMKALITAGRFGTPEDVAHTICFLASDRARYITGQVIEISGGLVL